MKTQRGASLKEVPEHDEQKKDLKGGVRAKKAVPPRKAGAAGASAAGQGAPRDGSATLPAPELEAQL